MKLLCFDSLEALDFPRLMEIYRESNQENMAVFFPEERDPERGLRRVEAKFYEYLKTDFFRKPDNRYYILAGEDRWASAIRIFPVPGRKGSWYAEALETAPALRRRGYARQLMELLLYQLAEQGAFELSDSVSKANAASLAFHEALGFQQWQDPACCPLNGTSNPRALGLRYRFAGWEACRIDPAKLSQRFEVCRLTAAELPELLDLCRSNPLFYEHCPPAPSEQTLLADMAALPPRKTLCDKYYLGFFADKRLAAVLDLIADYPRPGIAFWGFFMLDAKLQGQGRGTALVSELCDALRELGFRSVRLGWVQSNPQASHFWRKNGFRETGIHYDTDAYTVIVAQKELVRGGDHA